MKLSIITAVAIIITASSFPAMAGKGYEIGGVGPLGGIVYQIVDEDGLHGNEVTPEDFLSDFGCLGMPLRKRLEGLYNHGRDNTSDIFDGYCDGGSLANTAVNYEINGLKGWYVPTQNELHALYEHATRFSGDPIGIELSEDEYWSSTVLEEGWGLGEYAITVDFNNDTPHGVATNRGRNEEYRVRLVHEF